MWETEQSQQTPHSLPVTSSEKAKPSYIQLGAWAQELLEFSSQRTRTREREPPNTKARSCCGNGMGNGDGGCVLM